MEPAPEGDEDTGDKENEPEATDEIFGEMNDFSEGKKGENGEIDEPEHADGEKPPKRVQGPNDGNAEEGWEKQPRINGFKMREFCTIADEEKKAQKVEKNEPDERDRQLEVHGGVGA